MIYDAILAVLPSKQRGRLREDLRRDLGAGRGVSVYGPKRTKQL